MPLLDALCFQNGQVLKIGQVIFLPLHNIKMVFPALVLKIILTIYSPTY